MMFRAIISDTFPPFGKFLWEIPPIPNKPSDLAEVHLLTGVNGTGKTRLLSLVAAVLGDSTALALRAKNISTAVSFAVTDSTPLPPRISTTEHSPNPGKWSRYVYSGGNTHPASGTFNNWGSMVPAFAYRGIAYVGDADVKGIVAVNRPSRSQCLSFDRGVEISKDLLQAITNLKVQAAMDTISAEHTKDQTPAMKLMRALETTVSKITGSPFRFDVETRPTVSLRVFWGNTKLPFAVLPDGLRSIIGWLIHALVMMDLWLQGAMDPADVESVFLLDEIESHLHPAWQRRVLPAFQHLFPKSQIFVATHSPFVISSLNHGWIHCLTVNVDYSVKIEPPKAASEGSNYISAVENIMGVTEWFDEESEKLLREFRGKRDEAFQGNVDAEKEARRIATKISGRSMELSFMMGKELNQMDRQLGPSSSQ